LGGFYGSVQIRGVDRSEVTGLLEKLSRKQKMRFLVGPLLGEWVGVYPEGGGQDVGIGIQIARKLKGELFQLLVHDDDFLAYQYYRDGKAVDQYNSRPDYFAPASARHRRKLQGQPELFAHLLRDTEAVSSLKTKLAEAEAEPFAYVALQAFAEALGILNAVASYEYLREGETDDIAGWDQFIHIPDLASEEAKEREAEAVVRAKKTAAMKEGLLLKEIGGLRGRDCPGPWCCRAPDGQSFLVAWSGHASSEEKPCELERYGSPWEASPVPFSMSIDGHIYNMCVSRSGRYLAVGHAAGDWKATLWDLVEKRRIAESPQVRAVSWVGFTPDERAMISVSNDGQEGRVVIQPVDGSSARALSLKHASRAACHPGGRKLAVIDDRNRLSVVELETLHVETASFVGGRRVAATFEQGMIEQIKASVANIDYEKVGQTIRKQHEQLLRSLNPKHLPEGINSIEELKQQLEQGVAEQLKSMREQNARLGTPEWLSDQLSGSEGVYSMLFDKSGDRLCLGTQNGLRVYRWDEVAKTQGDMPRPIMAVDLGSKAMQIGNSSTQQEQYVYTLEYDEARDWILFSGLEGRVRYLDLASGRSGVLLEPPEDWPILQVELSSDRSALAVRYQPDFYSQKVDKRGAAIGFWNYRALCEKTS
jgi:WD40 repeat protein